MTNANQMMAYPDLHNVVAKARAIHNPQDTRPTYGQLKRLSEERAAARSLRLQEMYEFSGLVFCLPSLNPYSDE